MIVGASANLDLKA